MNYLLVAATAKEIKPFIQQYQKGKIASEVDIIISGIGLTATSYYITKQLFLKKYDCVIQAGVAGCFDTRIPLGTVVTVKQDTVADESVVELQSLKSIFDLGLLPHNRYPYKKGWLINPFKELIRMAGLRAVNGISVNQISTNRQMIGFYRKQFRPVTESMEGAALHYACLMEHVPFLQIRSISNYIGERNKKKWNMKASVQNLNHELVKLFNQKLNFTS